MASAALVPAYYLVNASWASAARRGLELDPVVAAYAFDVDNIGFANTWLALGSFAWRRRVGDVGIWRMATVARLVGALSLA